MSTTVDQRVVEMRFDNQQFEANVQTSMNTLDKLKKSLDMDDAAKGFESIDDAAKNCDMSVLSSAITGVQNKFSALEVMGVTALVNITNSAINAGKQLLSAFTIEPISTGFSEYELKMDSVQTILANTASKGKTLEDVTSVLDELNTYADKTIYNFAEMTRNIGTFTAAGVGLEESAKAIQGIANLAAISGSTSQQASTAMYQLSQALAAGVINLQDWNSVVNAGMGGEKFQEALKSTAREYGVAVDDIIEKSGSFRESIREGWITADLMNETLNKFTVEGAQKYAQSMMEAGKYTQEQTEALVAEAQAMEDAATKVKTFTQLMDTLKEAAQSGWATSWEIIVGDFNEAKELFTEVSDFFGNMISKSADSRNSLLKGALGSSWEQIRTQIEDTGISIEDFQDKLIEVGKKYGAVTDDMITESGSFEKSLKSGWLTSNIFAEALRSFTGGATEVSTVTETMTSKLEEFDGVVNRVIRGDFGNGADRVEALTQAGYDYATIQDLVNHKLLGTEIHVEELSDAQLESIGYTEEQIAALRDLAEQAEQSGTPLNELIEQMSRPSGRELLIDSIRNALKGLVKVIETIKGAWTDIFPPTTSEQLYSLISMIHSFSEKLVMSDETADKLKRTLKGLFAVLDIIATITGGALRIAFEAAKYVLSLFNLDILDVTANIGDALVALRDWVDEHNVFKKALDKVVPVLSTMISTVKSWIQAFLQLPVVRNAIEQFEETLSSFGENLSGYFQDGGEVIGAFIERVKQVDSLTLDNVLKVLKDFVDNVLGYFLNFDGLIDRIKKAFFGFSGEVSNVFSGAEVSLVNFKTTSGTLLDSVCNLFSNFKERLFETVSGIRDAIASKLDFGAIFAIGIGVGMVAFTKKISDAVETIAKPFEGLSDIFDGVKGVLDSFAKSLKAFSTKVKSEALKNVAEAILMLVAALVVLAMIPSDKLLQSVLTLGVLAAGLVVLYEALGKLGSNPAKLTGVAGTLISFGASVLLLATAMKTLTSLDTDDIVSSLGVITVLMVELMAVSKWMGSKGEKSYPGLLSMIGFALSLKILVGTIEDISNMQINNLGQTVGILASCVVALIAVSKLCGKTKLSAGASMLLTVVALQILADCFQDIAELDLTGAKRNMGAFVAIFATFAAVMVASKFAGENASKAGSAILKMSAALTLVVLAIKMMTSIDPTDLDRCTETIAKLMLVFSAVTVATKFAGENAGKAGTAILAMSAGILLLSASMLLLAQLNEDDLERSLAAVTVLEAMFAAIIGMSRFAGDAKSTILAMSVAIAALVAAVAVLCLLEPARLAGAVAAVSVLMGMLALVVASTKFAINATKTLITVTAVIAVLAGIITAMSALDVQNSLENASALGVLMTALSASLLIISKADDISMKTVGQLAIMAAIMAAIAVVIGYLESMGLSVSIENAASLSILLLSLSAACVILSKVGATGAAAFVGVGALVTLIGAVGGVMAAICYLTQDYPTVDEDLDRAIMIMEKIGTGLGAVIGGFVGGVLGSLTSSLPIIGWNLSAFMTNAEPFFDAVKNVDADSMSGIQSLVGAMTSLMGASILDAFTTWLTGGVSFADFGTQLCAFGSAIVDYADVVKGADFSGVEASATAGTLLANLADIIPNSGGWLGKLVGNNDLGSFGIQACAFGSAIVAYAETVNGKDFSGIEASVKASAWIVALANILPEDKGFFSNLFGGNSSLQTFGTQLTTFGTALTDYAGTIDIINVEKMSSVTEQIWNLLQVISALDGIDPQTLSSFSEKLKEMGETSIEELVSAFENSADDVSESVNNVISTAEQTVEAETNNSESTGLFDKIKSLFTGGIESSSDDVSGAVTDLMSSMSSSVTEGVTGENGVGTSLSDGLSELGTTIDTCGLDVDMDSLMNETVSAVDGYENSFNTAGQNCGTGLVNGILSKLSSAKSAGSQLGQAALNGAMEKLAIHSPSKEFMYLGENVGKGFEIGIDNTVQQTSAAASNMATQAIAAASKGLDYWEDWLDEKQFYNEIDTAAELAGLKKLQTMYKAGSDERKQIDRDVYTAQNALVDETYQNQMDWMEEEEFYGRLNTQQKLDAYKLIQNQYMEGSEQRKEIDREIYTLENELEDEWYQNIEDHIDEETFYGRMSTAEQLQIWKDALNEVEEGGEKYKEIMREIYTLSNQLASEWYQDLQDYINEEEFWGRMTAQKEADYWKDAIMLAEAGSDEYYEIEKKYFTAHNNALNEAYQNLKDHIDEEEFYNRITTYEKLELWEKYLNTVEEGTEEYKNAAREVYTLTNDLADEAYQNLEDYIEEEEFYNRISISEKLKLWKNYFNTLEEGTEQYKNAAREVYTLTNELADEMYQNIQDYIDEETYYGRMSLAEELAAQRRAQRVYAEGTKERLEANRKVYDLEKEIYEAQEQYFADVEAAQEDYNDQRLELEEEYADKVEEINERLEQDIQDLNDAYQNALESRENTLYDAYGLFDEVTEKEEVSGETLMKNLQDQVLEFGDWQDALNSLSGRGLSDDLIDELQEMGPSAIAEIKALNAMSDDELDKYAALWSEKHALAYAQALDELEDMRVDTQEQIVQLQEDADAELEDYKAIWEENMAELEENLQNQLDQLEEDFDKTVGIIEEDTDAKLAEMTSVANEILREAGWDETGEQIVQDLITGVESEAPNFIDTLTDMVDEAKALVTDGWQDFYDESKPIMTDGWQDFYDESKPIMTDGWQDFYNSAISDSEFDFSWNELGEQITQGFTSGVENETPNFVQTLTEMVSSGVDEVKAILQINSPSRVFQTLGNYVGQGFVNGLHDYADKTYEAGSELAESSRDGLSDAISNLVDFVENGMDTEPTIHPVLDLSNITNGIDELNGTLFSDRSIRLAGQTAVRLSSSVFDNQVGFSVDNTDVVAELRQLRTDVSNLAGQMNQMQIVMDTGTLVGELAALIDSALGRRAILAGRRI